MRTVSRREVVAAGAAMAAIAGEASAMTESQIGPVVATRSGPVVGRRAGRVNVYRGIPYARPPVGALRFRPPDPAVAWREPLDAGAFGPGPIQPAIPLIQIPSGTSEACLTLNVWTPAEPGPHPVLFSIYGGGNILGASSQPSYDGTSFAEQGVVFVSANYRLGALGFMELGGIDPAYAGSGLNGLRDLEAALIWVRDNIEGFGGDPGQVSLMGVSAGGKNQCALAAMPSARGLFRRMAVQSGGGHTVFRSVEEATPVAEMLLAAVGLERRDIAGLAAAPAEAVLAAQGKVLVGFPRGFPFRPTVDGKILPQAPIEAARAGMTAGVDIVIGTARDEAALALTPVQAEQAPFRAGQLANLDLDRMRGLEPRYAEVLPDLSLGERRLRQLTAEEFWVPCVRFAEAHARAGGRTWMYRFDWAPSAGPFAGHAVHGSDGAFIYGGRGAVVADDARAEVARVHAMWAGWARTGELRLEGGTDWPRYELSRRDTLIFDRINRLEAGPRGEELRLWDAVL
jgi:para-nitrobenzyl esterase